MTARACQTCGRVAGSGYWAPSRAGYKRHVRVVLCNYAGAHLCRTCLLAAVRPLALEALRRYCSRRRRETIEKRGQLRLASAVEQPS